ncbi:hypothetical protein GCM10019815_02780 [Pediococcus damnosus]|nr:hypothetical protein BSQ36_05635 [Pediococcus damnosus]
MRKTNHELSINKKYIASHLATPTASLTEINPPEAGLLFENDGKSSFFYLDSENDNVFFEKHDNLLFKHVYDPATHNFKTTSL